MSPVKWGLSTASQITSTYVTAQPATLSHPPHVVAPEPRREYPEQARPSSEVSFVTVASLPPLQQLAAVPPHIADRFTKDELLALVMGKDVAIPSPEGAAKPP